LGLSIIKQSWAKLNNTSHVTLSRKRKVESECRLFQEKWTEECFCVSTNGKILCLICNESIDVLKEYKIAWHCNSQHKEKHKNCFSALRRQKGGFSHNRMSSENNPMAVPPHCEQVTVIG